MKKCKVLFLAFAAALSLVACSGEKDPKEIYDKAVKKTSEMTSMDMTYVINMKMPDDEEIQDLNLNLDMKLADIKTDKVKYLSELAISNGDNKMDISMYYEDGYYYMDTMGQKLKSAIDVDSLMEQVEMYTQGAGMDYSLMNNINAEKSGENQIFTFTVDPEKLDSSMKDIMKIFGNKMDDVTFKECSGEATVNKDGYLSNSKLKITLETELQDKKMDMEMDITYNNPGQPVEITAPDLEGYVEIDADALGF